MRIRVPSSTRQSLATAVAVVATAVAAVVLPAPATSATGVLAPAVPLPAVPDQPSQYHGQVSCDPVAKPGTRALRDLVLGYYGIGRDGGMTRTCGGSRSEHSEGRAWDWMVNVNDPVQKQAGDDFVLWLTAPDATGVPGGNAHRLGVMYVIWNRQTWQAWTGTWKPYTGASPHTDHVHISLSWHGAMKRTSWWTGAAVTNQDYGPCREYSDEFAPAYSAPRYKPCPKVGPRPTGQVATSVAQDFDRDGLADTLGRLTAGSLYHYPNDSTGTATKRVFAGSGWNILDVLVDVQDVTGDGIADLWGRERATGVLWLYTGNGAGGFSTRRPVGSGWNMHDALLTAGDVTGDGVADLWARDRAHGTLWLYTGDGRGSFSSVRSVGSGWGMHATLVGTPDMDGDGRPEVFGIEKSTGIRWYYQGDGKGGFVTRRAVDWGWNTLDLVV